MTLLYARNGGFVAMKNCARNYLWWSQFYKEIKEIVCTCQSCQSMQRLHSEVHTPC